MKSSRSILFWLIASIVASGAQCASATTSGVATATSTEFETLLKRGYEQMKNGSFGPAVGTLTRAVKANKNSAMARRYLCYALLQEGEIDNAFEQMLAITRLKQPAAIDYYLLGEVHLAQGSNVEAQKDFTNALIKQPGMSAASAGLVKTCVNVHDWEGALKICAHCISSSEPKDATSKALNAYFKKLYAAIKEAQASSGVQTQLPPVAGPQAEMSDEKELSNPTPMELTPLKEEPAPVVEHPS